MFVSDLQSILYRSESIFQCGCGFLSCFRNIDLSAKEFRQHGFKYMIAQKLAVLRTA
jgi:hypothetical protein